MWKKIGLKRDGNSPAQSQGNSLNASPQMTSRSKYTRKTPLNEKSLAERDLSNSRISESSRDIQKIVSQSSILQGLKLTSVSRLEEDDLGSVNRHGGSQKRLPEIEKVATSRETGHAQGRNSSKDLDTSVTKKSPLRPAVTFVQKPSVEKQGLGEGQKVAAAPSALKQSAAKQNRKETKQSVATLPNAQNATNEFIQNLQVKLREMRKVNIRYQVKVAEARKMYGEMKNLVKSQLLALADFCRNFVNHATKQIVNEVTKQRKAEQAILKQTQAQRDELKEKLKQQIHRSQVLKSQLEGLKRQHAEQPPKGRLVPIIDAKMTQSVIQEDKPREEKTHIIRHQADTNSSKSKAEAVTTKIAEEKPTIQLKPVTQSKAQVKEEQNLEPTNQPSKPNNVIKPRPSVTIVEPTVTQAPRLQAFSRGQPNRPRPNAQIQNSEHLMTESPSASKIKVAETETPKNQQKFEPEEAKREITPLPGVQMKAVKMPDLPIKTDPGNPSNYQGNFSTILGALSKMKSSINDLSNYKQSLQDKVQAQQADDQGTKRVARTIVRTTRAT